MLIENLDNNSPLLIGELHTVEEQADSALNLQLF